MQIERCLNCGTLALPPARICSKCRAMSFEPVFVSGTGSLYTFTTIHVPPEEFSDQAPYHFVVVQLEEGLLLPARLSGSEESDRLTVGAPVEFVTQDERGFVYRLRDKA